MWRFFRRIARDPPRQSATLLIRLCLMADLIQYEQATSIGELQVEQNFDTTSTPKSQDCAFSEHRSGAFGQAITYDTE